jgi:2-oxoglutarate ferredoxin oxidoreductase subunit beta
MHDGSYIRLKKTDENYDPRNRENAIVKLEKAQREQLFITGLLYYEEPRMTLAQEQELTDTPLAQLQPESLRPPKSALDKIMNSMM